MRLVPRQMNLATIGHSAACRADTNPKLKPSRLSRRVLSEGQAFLLAAKFIWRSARWYSFIFACLFFLSGCTETPKDQTTASTTQQASSPDPQAANAEVQRARELMDKRLFRQAAEAYEKAATLAPNDVDILLAWIGARQSAGDERQTEELTRRALKLAPDNPKAMVFLGTYLAKLSERPDARKEAKPLLEKVTQLVPTMPIPYIELGQLQRRDGDYAAAQKTLTTAWKLLHNGMQTLRRLETMEVVEARRSETAYALALCARALKKPADSKKWFAEFRTVDARIEKRLQLAPLAHSNPPNLNALVALAQLNMANGGAEEAVPLLKHALTVAPEDKRVLALVETLKKIPAD
jgi:tetratricopeptide (TPR) repeat protein